MAKKDGAVYTPEKLSQYVAYKILHYAIKDGIFNNLEEMSIIDPAVGDGMLLDSMIECILDNKKSTGKKLTVCGVDINKAALSSCKKNLFPKRNDEIQVELLNKNALHPLNHSTLANGWHQIFKKIGLAEGFDLLIANPPWGADLTAYKNKLKMSDFRTNRGQFDSFELFMELAVKIVKPNGYFGFIVPDSILNNGKSILRELLLEQTQIKFIARLGEKIFPNVNRACVVIICKNTPCKIDCIVDCFRLSSKNRTFILNDQLTFLDTEYSNIHQVPQKRFKNNTFQRFDIDIKENDVKLLDKIKKHGKILGEEVSITRGMELGSSGMVCQCESCDTWYPLSQKKVMACPTCGNNFNPKNANTKCIISSTHSPKSIPFISGSGMKRYICKPSKWTTLGIKGINYKPKELYTGAKILIRKTGVGITAALDYSNSYTNQVVYILKNRNMQEDNLEFFMGLINSRVYFFYLMKTFGELEWKSHPYLTQTQICNLPLPDLNSNENKKIINEITFLLHPILKTGKIPNNEIDIKVELLIGKMFSLDKNDYKIIFDTIFELDDLLPMRELKKVNLTDFLEKMN